MHKIEMTLMTKTLSTNTGADLEKTVHDNLIRMTNDALNELTVDNIDDKKNVEIVLERVLQELRTKINSEHTGPKDLVTIIFTLKMGHHYWVYYAGFYYAFLVSQATCKKYDWKWSVPGFLRMCKRGIRFANDIIQTETLTTSVHVRIK